MIKNRSPRGMQIAAAFVVLVVAALLALNALSSSGQRLTRTNSVSAQVWVVGHFGPRDGRLCSDNQFVPAGTGAVRVLVGTYRRPGPELTVELVNPDDGRTLARGAAENYVDGAFVTMPVDRQPLDLDAASVCFSVSGGEVAFAGDPTGVDDESTLTRNGKKLRADIHLDFLREGKQTLFSQIPTILKRATLFRPGWMGTWTFYLAFAAALILLGLMLKSLLGLSRDEPVNVRRWAVNIMAFAMANAFLWSIVSPPFQPPDEAAHYSYIESLAVRGARPYRVYGPGYGSYTARTDLAQKYTAAGIVLNDVARLPWRSSVEDDWRNRDAKLPSLGKRDGGGWTSAAGYSPLYYGPAVIPYELSDGTSTFTRLWILRLWSVLLCGIAALFAFLFARELAPRSTWFAPVAGLAVAFEPMAAHIGGSVQNDNMLIAFASATLYLLARALRRGIGWRSAIVIGGVFALGVVAKPTMYGLAPAVGLGLVIAAARSHERRSVRVGRLGAAAAVSLAVIMIAQVVWGKGDSASATLAGAAAGEPFTPSGFASYLWQWYLPKLPFMQEFAPDTLPVISVYVRGFIANFNHLDTHFAEGWDWVYAAGLTLLLAGAVTLAWRNRDQWRTWWPLPAVAATAVAGIAILVNLRSYLALLESGSPFAQGRYLLPIVAVFGALVAAGSKGIGRRHGLAVATAIVLSLALMNIFGMAISFQRFYL